MNEEVLVTPLLKWAGGKSRLAPRIALALAAGLAAGGDGEGLNAGTAYVEPFCGSLAVYLYLRSRFGIGTMGPAPLLCDTNRRVVAFHQAVRDTPYDVLEELGRLPADGSYREAYNTVRTAFNEGMNGGARHAARMLWLNKACFNGLFRENKKGMFNVPVGRYERLSLPSADQVYQVSRLLEGTRLEALDFPASLRLAREGWWIPGTETWGERKIQKVVYCDPPYVPLSETASFTGYAAGGFGLEDQAVLGRELVQTARAGAVVVLSQADLPAVTDKDGLFAGLEVVDRFEVQRSISRGARGKAGEVLMRAVGS
jgi:DNA adenine methylase